MPAAVEGLARIRHQQADCVELRLDHFDEPFDLEALLRERGDLPVVATLRPPDQGGRSQLPPDERLSILLKAALLGAEYVDLEDDVATPSAIASLRAAGARVIVSRHDFGGMPQDLARTWWRELSSLDADVVKRAATPTCDPNGQIHVDDFMKLQDFFLQRGQLSYQKPIDFKSLVDTSYAERALQVLGSYKP